MTVGAGIAVAGLAIGAGIVFAILIATAAIERIHKAEIRCITRDDP